MNAVLRTPDEETDRLVARFLGHRVEPSDAANADGLEVTDCTGVIRGNADLADSCEWTPTTVTAGTTPLPTYPLPADKEPTA